MSKYIPCEKQQVIAEIADKLEDYCVEFYRKNNNVKNHPDSCFYGRMYSLIFDLRTSFVKIKTLEDFFNGGWVGLSEEERNKIWHDAISTLRDNEHEKRCSSLCIKPEAECEHKHNRYFCKSHLSCEREKEVKSE